MAGPELSLVWALDRFLACEALPIAELAELAENIGPVDVLPDLPKAWLCLRLVEADLSEGKVDAGTLNRLQQLAACQIQGAVGDPSAVRPGSDLLLRVKTEVSLAGIRSQTPQTSRQHAALIASLMRFVTRALAALPSPTLQVIQADIEAGRYQPGVGGLAAGSPAADHALPALPALTAPAPAPAALPAPAGLAADGPEEVPGAQPEWPEGKEEEEEEEELLSRCRRLQEGEEDGPAPAGSDMRLSRSQEAVGARERAAKKHKRAIDISRERAQEQGADIGLGMRNLFPGAQALACGAAMVNEWVLGPQRIVIRDGKDTTNPIIKPLPLGGGKGFPADKMVADGGGCYPQAKMARRMYGLLAQKRCPALYTQGKGFKKTVDLLNALGHFGRSTEIAQYTLRWLYHDTDFACGLPEAQASIAVRGGSDEAGRRRIAQLTGYDVGQCPGPPLTEEEWAKLMDAVLGPTDIHVRADDPILDSNGRLLPLAGQAPAAPQQQQQQPAVEGSEAAGGAEPMGE